MQSRFEKEFPVYQKLVSNLPEGYPDKDSYTSGDNTVLKNTIASSVFYQKLENGSLKVYFMSRGRHPLLHGGFLYFETDAQTAEKYMETHE